MLFSLFLVLLVCFSSIFTSLVIQCLPWISNCFYTTINITQTHLFAFYNLYKSSSENQTCARVTVNVTEMPPPAIDCIECLWIRWNMLKTKCTKIGFLSKKRVAEDIQDILSKKVFEFLFFFVLLFVSILLLSSCLWRFRTEHQRFTSLKQQHEHVKQQDERCWATKEYENDVR